MSPRNSVIVALLILVALGAYVYFSGDDAGTAGRGAQGTASEAVSVLALDRDEVDAISIERRDGTVIRLARVPVEPAPAGEAEGDGAAGGGGAADGDAASAGEESGESGGEAPAFEWRMVEPVAWKADSMRVSSMLGILSNLTAERVLAGDSAGSGEPGSGGQRDGSAQPEGGAAGGEYDEAAYGLDNPQAVVTVSTGQGETRLEIGERTPIGTTYYARIAGDNRLFTIAAYQVDPFLRPVIDYRDRTILSFSTGSVRRLEIESASGLIVAEEKDGEWNLVSPLLHPADSDEINELLTPLASLYAQEFIDDPESLEAYGLAEPQTVVRVAWESGEDGELVERVVYVGRAKDDRTAYVKTDGETVFAVTLNPSLYREVSAESLALKDLVRTTDIFTLHIELYGPEGLSLELNKTEKPEIIWRRGDGLVVPGSVMTDFLGAVIAIDAQDLGRPLAPGEAESLNYVTLILDPPPNSPEGAPPRVVRFGEPDENGMVQVVANDRDRLYTVPAKILEDLLARANEILSLVEPEEEPGE